MSLLLISRIAGTSVIDAAHGVAPAAGDANRAAAKDLACGLFGCTGPAEARRAAPRSWRGRPWSPDGLMTAA
jgi:hypothetical protein